MSRRRFFALAGGGALAGLSVDAWLVEPRRERFTHHVVNARASADQRAVRFVQITDLHLKQVGRMHRRIAAKVGRMAPDFIVLTGDSVDEADRLGELAAFLALLDRATPKYAILGNWEHWSGVDLAALDSVYRGAGCRLLVDDHAIHEKDGRSVRITGMDDLIGGKSDARRALGGPAGDAHVILAHCPRHRDILLRRAMPKMLELPPLPSASYAEASLVLSGHTHGGQVSLFGWTPFLPGGSGAYVRGWFREPGKPPMYVCCGIGTSMLPVRLGARPEVAVFTLWV